MICMSDPAARVTLRVPRSAPLGSKVPIVVLIENESAAPVELYLRGREIAYDIRVTRAGGDVVWRRLEGQVVPAILRLETIAPGKPIELRDSWDQRNNAGETVAPGEYAVSATVLSDGHSTLESVTLPLRIDRR